MAVGGGVSDGVGVALAVTVGVGVGAVVGTDVAVAGAATVALGDAVDVGRAVAVASAPPGIVTEGKTGVGWLTAMGEPGVQPTTTSKIQKQKW